MGRRSRELADPRLTDAEHEVMEALWALGQADVHELRAKLGDDRAYTTISTIVRILETKGFATSTKDGRRHVYAPATPKPAWEAATVHDLVRRVFAGDVRSLVRTLLDAEEVAPEDLAAIRKLLDEEKGR